MASYQPMQGSGLNITNADYRYQQNQSRFNAMAEQQPYHHQPYQQHRGQPLRRPKSTGELSTLSNGGVYGNQYGTGDYDYREDDHVAHPQTRQMPYSPYDAPVSAPYRHRNSVGDSRNGIPNYPEPYNPRYERQEQDPRTSIRDRQIPASNSSSYHGQHQQPQYTQPVQTPRKQAHQPASPDVRRSIGPGIAVPGFRSQPGSPYIPLVENDSVRTYGSGVFPPRVGGPRKRALSEGEVQLNRQGTLLTPHATEKRASAELGIMLGSGRQKLQTGKLLPQGELPIEERLAKLDQVKLEAKKGRKARVEVDVILESDVMVEGGELRGRLEVRIRKSRRGESLWIGAGKVRVCGYEGDCPVSLDGDW